MSRRSNTTRRSVRRDVLLPGVSADTATSVQTRKALVIGIDYYAHAAPLHGCASDARAMAGMLAWHGDGTVNFDVSLSTGTRPADAVGRAPLRQQIKRLFSEAHDIALFYFAGHGHLDVAGGYLLTSDAVSGDDGVSLSEILALANRSRSDNKIIILDSCHSGIAGNSTLSVDRAELVEGLTILAASGANQYATEESGAGTFTALFVDALSGAAANLLGEVTPGSIYAHIDKSLGRHGQRPVFKTNVKEFVSLRKVAAAVEPADLQRLPEFFGQPGAEFPLDPSFEPEGPCPDPRNTEKFAVLQRYNRVNLVVPVGVVHMYHAAMKSKSCRLTVLGEHYRRLVVSDRI
jgi:hypothetical protein